jgi:hypothetical protein
MPALAVRPWQWKKKKKKKKKKKNGRTHRPLSSPNATPAGPTPGRRSARQSW